MARGVRAAHYQPTYKQVDRRRSRSRRAATQRIQLRYRSTMDDGFKEVANFMIDFDRSHSANDGGRS